MSILPHHRHKYITLALALGAALGGLMFMLLLMIILPGMTAGSPANDAQSDITTLVAGIKSKYRVDAEPSKDAIYGSLSEAEVLQDNIPPTSMTEDGGIQSEWGPVRIFPVNKEMRLQSPYELFVISYTNMPSSVCIKLVPGLHQNFQAIFIGNQPNPLKTGARRALSPSEIVHHCSSAESVYVDFVSK